MTPEVEPAEADGAAPAIPRQSLAAIFLRFLRFGLLAWGGPVAQIAMIQRELVEEERWISRQRFRRALAMYQVLPGPEAHELCVYFGMLARGRLGAILAGLGFMLPGFVLMLGLSALYAHGALQAAVHGFLDGVTAGVVGIMAATTFDIARHGIVDLGTAEIAVVALIVLWTWKSRAAVPVVVLGGGLLGFLLLA